ncbi:MAG: redoxin domain-containing protein, partial [Myxococcota bacterium]
MTPATTQKLAVLVMGAVILVAMVVWVESQGSTAIRRSMVEDLAVLDAELADRPAPDWTLTDLQGNPVPLTSLRGKVVFLNFWASWCAPCREEMPSMEELARKYQGRDLVMIA